MHMNPLKWAIPRWEQDLRIRLWWILAMHDAWMSFRESRRGVASASRVGESRRLSSISFHSPVFCGLDWTGLDWTEKA
jgi:hypothetical protein